MVLGGLLAGAAAGWLVRSRDAEPVAPPEPPPAAAAPAPREAPPVVAQDAPFVVLLIGCTMRWDQLTPYGGHRLATPTLQALADDGARFTHAISAAPWTRAASTALLTGHHPIEVGMIEPGPGANRRRLADEVTTLAEHFAGAGYATIGTTANPNLNEVFGFHQGFERYVEVTERWGKVGMVKVPGDEVVDGLLAAVDELPDDGRPRYLQAMLIDAHEPRTGSPRAVARMSDDGVPERVAMYRVNLRRFDKAVGRLLRGLEARGVDDPLVMVVSDHGEGLVYPFHHGKGHGSFTYESAVRMPWLVRGPGVARGHAIDGMASQVDVLPTLLELAGVGADGYAGPGKSWAAAIQGRADRTDRAVSFVDTWFQEASRVAAYRTDVACHIDTVDRDADRRLRPATACYDRASDPRADQPLPAPDDALVRQATEWRAAQKARYEAYPHTADVAVRAELAEQLEALGYVQDETP